MGEVEFYRWIGRLVKEHRIARNMNQDDLSLLLGLSRSSISNLECGRHFINAYILFKIFVLLDIPAESSISSFSSRIAH
jgi:transcriptional regulator with XRE-family HTH domain